MSHIWHILIQYTVYWHTAGYVIAFCYIHSACKQALPFKWQGEQAVQE